MTSPNEYAHLESFVALGADLVIPKMPLEGICSQSFLSTFFNHIVTVAAIQALVHLMFTNEKLSSEMKVLVQGHIALTNWPYLKLVFLTVLRFFFLIAELPQILSSFFSCGLILLET